MRVIVCGSRNWTDEAAIHAVLDGVIAKAVNTPGGYLTVVHGACPTGADAIADRWCERSGAYVERHLADWDGSLGHRFPSGHPYGKLAGPIRNEEMAEAGADLCVAFATGGPTEPVSRGTNHMVGEAYGHGIPVWLIRSIRP